MQGPAAVVLVCSVAVPIVCTVRHLYMHGVCVTTFSLCVCALGADVCEGAGVEYIRAVRGSVDDSDGNSQHAGDNLQCHGESGRGTVHCFG